MFVQLNSFRVSRVCGVRTDTARRQKEGVLTAECCGTLSRVPDSFHGVQQAAAVI